MTQDDIIRMAREAGFTPLGNFAWDGFDANLERFAALVADAEAKRIHDEGMVTVGHMREQIAAEREACAKVCEDTVLASNGGARVAAAIRARSEA